LKLRGLSSGSRCFEKN